MSYDICHTTYVLTLVNARFHNKSNLNILFSKNNKVHSPTFVDPKTIFTHDTGEQVRREDWT
ncbi:hypothetical protein HanIR_Chr12g0606711 [Helianthus annuus]|nr:hypothetical protein HanIR_Chr12g0606711 [Helianthus annuus]